MMGARAAVAERTGAARSHAGAQGARATHADDLFERIGAFLRTHRLGPDPAHYLFAHRVLSEPRGALAQAVARLTDDGVRLTRADVEALGGTVREAEADQSDGAEAEARAARMTAEAHAQVTAFAGIARTARDEARGFGRDLAHHAAGIARVPAAGGTSGSDEVVRLAAAMVARVREAENRLAEATAQADGLRVELEEARVTARRDPLTALPNRRALEEAYAVADRARPLWIAVCDVDRFKRINDEHGHSVGDRVLRAIGGALQAACGTHLVARHGGEEFALLISDADRDEALALVESAREAVGAKRFRTRETDRPISPVTISAGVTAVLPGETLEEALARADRYLYAAKAAGRDCCRLG